MLIHGMLTLPLMAVAAVRSLPFLTVAAVRALPFLAVAAVRALPFLAVAAVRAVPLLVVGAKIPVKPTPVAVIELISVRHVIHNIMEKLPITLLQWSNSRLR